MSAQRWCRAAGAALALLLAATAQAQVPATWPADPALPPAELALPAIAALPEVQRKAAELDAARAAADMRAIGSSEARVTLIPQQRRVQDGPNYREWELDLDKSVRWPHKVALDRRIGALGVEAAQLALEDAHHAGARLLLQQWSDWLRAAANTRSAQQQLALLDEERVALARRVAAGDAAQRDLLAVDAARAEADAARIEAEQTEQATRRTLRASFPALPIPQRAPLPVTVPELPGSAASWRARILEVSHEIGVARAQAEQQQALAERARSERLPDPTLGVRVISELGGREKLYGVVLGLPLGLRYRGAEAAQAAAQARVAQQDLNLMRREVQLGAAQTVAAAQARHALWQARELAAQAAQQNLAKQRRAHVLSESGIAELLQAARSAGTAEGSAARAAVDAIEALERVAVDAHARWHRHDEDEHQADAHAPATSADALRLPTLGAPSV